MSFLPPISMVNAQTHSESHPEQSKSSEQTPSAEVEATKGIHTSKFFKILEGRGTTWKRVHYFDNRADAETAVSARVDRPFKEDHFFNGIEAVDSLPGDVPIEEVTPGHFIVEVDAADAA